MPRAVKRLAKKWVRLAKGNEARCCYEAGPSGYALQRQMVAAASLIVEVIAPALIPRKPGGRVKTGRRDARKLCELPLVGLHKDGMFVPDEEPFKGWLLGLATTATDPEFPGEYQTQMSSQLAANQKGNRFASQISTWLMAGASKARVGNGEASVEPRSETVGVAFFHEFAIHVFFHLLMAPPEVERHGFEAKWADQLEAHL